ncbi:MAG: hypothetical protein QXS42_07400 [Zestosphaera sp.]
MIESLGKGRRVHRDIGKAYVFKVLNIMKHYYSLRDIEKMLDLPAQTIWKYVNLMIVPEEKTVAKIISKVDELRVIDRLIDESLREFRENPVKVLSKPGFLKLFSYVAESFVGNAKIDLVIPVSNIAMILGSYLATELPSILCPFTEDPIHDKKGYVVAYYANTEGVNFMAMPRSCLKEKPTSLLIDVTLDELNKLRSVLEALSRAKVNVYGVVAVEASDDVWDFVKNNGLRLTTLRHRHY